jgi:hypothetical protein
VLRPETQRLLTRSLPKPSEAVRIGWLAVGAALLGYLFVYGLGTWGYMDARAGRAVYFPLCAGLGTVGLLGWAAGAFDGPLMARARKALVALLCVVGWCGLQTIPIPNAIVTIINPAWGPVLASMERTGLEVPTRIPLALSPERAADGWHLLLAATAAFAGMLAMAARGGWRFLAGVVMLLAIAEGLLGLGNFLAQPGSRAYGGIYNPNHHAALTLCGLPVAIAMLWNRHERLRETLGEGLFSGRDVGLLGVGAVAAASAGWVASASRGSLVFGAPFLLLWTLYEWRLLRRAEAAEFGEDQPTRWMESLLLGLVMIPTVAIVALLAGGDQFIARVDGSKSELFSDAGRVAQSLATLSGWAETNWMGLGIGGTEAAISRFLDMPLVYSPIHTHCDWLQFSAEVGLPGLLLLAAALIPLGRSFLPAHRLLTTCDPADARIRRAAAAGLATLLGHALVDFHLRIPLIAIAALLLLALALVPPPAPDSETD